MRGSYPSTTRKRSGRNQILYFFTIFRSSTDRATRILSDEGPTIVPAQQDNPVFAYGVVRMDSD